MDKLIDWIASRTILFFTPLIFVALVFWLAKFEKKLKIRLAEAMLMAIAHIVIGLLSTKLLALVEVGFDFEKSANMRVYGAIFVVPLFYYIWARITSRKIALTMDVAAICVIIGIIAGRVNCLTQGCCDGIPVFFNQEYHWPLREIELVFYVIFIVLYQKKIRKQETYGQVYSIYMITYGLLRFVCEFVREEFTTQIGFLRLAHVWSLISIGVGLIWYFYIVRKTNYKKLKNKLGVISNKNLKGR